MDEVRQAIKAGMFVVDSLHPEAILWVRSVGNEISLYPVKLGVRFYLEERIYNFLMYEVGKCLTPICPLKVREICTK